MSGLKIDDAEIRQQRSIEAVRAVAIEKPVGTFRTKVRSDSRDILSLSDSSSRPFR